MIVEKCECPGCQAMETQSSSFINKTAARICANHLLDTVLEDMSLMSLTGMSKEQKIEVWDLALLSFTVNLRNQLEILKNGEEQ